jgi:hypothetical protein
MTDAHFRVKSLETEVKQLKKKPAESKIKIVRLAEHMCWAGNVADLIEVQCTNPQSRQQKSKGNFYANADRSVRLKSKSPNR